ncbi:hypothetical protein ACFQX4_22680 [Roseomonas sp. GCM10028921]
MANDGDNLLRAYRPNPGSTGRAVANLGRPVPPNSNRMDLEGAAALRERTYWIGSHSRNNDGERRTARHGFFATVWQDDAVVLAPGTQSVSLLDALSTLAEREASRFPELRRFIGGAATDKNLAPDRGGLNIEGLAAGADESSLLLGLRSPRREADGAAFVISLRNPAAVVERGVDPDFGTPIPLDLGRRGIRSMEWLPGRRTYLIVAGSAGDRTDSSKTFDLYSWAGPGSAPVRLEGAEALLQNLVRPGEPSPPSTIPFGPEALMVESHVPGRPVRIRLLSDDGDDKTGGSVECQDLPPEDAGRRFRSLLLDLDLQ